jgi:hypothetical protein
MTYLILLCFSFGLMSQKTFVMKVHHEFDQNGITTKRWLDGLKSRGEFDANQIKGEVTPKIKEWIAFVKKHESFWEAIIQEQNRLFDDSIDTINILIGITGPNDAFIAQNKYICFNLPRIQELYGDVSKPSNQDRLIRFFRHEYSHLLNKRYAKQKNVPLSNPLERAIWHAWNEGLGHYYSLSKSWKPNGTTLPEKTIKALNRLEPIFVERMNQLSQTNDYEKEMELTRDLSFGPFNKKWGALTVALWIMKDVEMNHHSLKALIKGGEKSAIYLAKKYLPEALRNEFEKLYP